MPGRNRRSVWAQAVARRLARLLEGSSTYERTASISVFELPLPLHTVANY